jgi:hypothetical protein
MAMLAALSIVYLGFVRWKIRLRAVDRVHASRCRFLTVGR